MWLIKGDTRSLDYGPYKSKAGTPSPAAPALSLVLPTLEAWLG